MTLSSLGGGSTDLGPAVRTYVSGRYYSPIAGALTTTAPALGTQYFVPLWVPGSVTIDKIGVAVTTTAVGATARLGIYNNATGDLPGTILTTDYGTVDCATATGNVTKDISQALTRGLWWLSVAIQGTNAATFRCMTGTCLPVAPTSPTTTGNNIENCYILTGQTGALPASAAGFTAGWGSVRVFVRAA